MRLLLLGAVLRSFKQKGGYPSKRKPLSTSVPIVSKIPLSFHYAKSFADVSPFHGWRLIGARSFLAGVRWSGGCSSATARVALHESKQACAGGCCCCVLALLRCHSAVTRRFSDSSGFLWGFRTDRGALGERFFQLRSCAPRSFSTFALIAIAKTAGMRVLVGPPGFEPGTNGL